MKMRLFVTLLLLLGVQSVMTIPAFAAGEVEIVIPDLNQATFFGSIPGPTLLKGGIGVAVLGLVFGLIIFQRLNKMPVHSSMREISELIYETCKTYLLTQGKFL